MSTRTLRLTTAVAAAALGAATLLAAGGSAAAAPSASSHGPTLGIQILSFNDFHGNLEPPAGSSGRVIVSDNYHESRRPTRHGATTYSVTADTQDAGGVEYLATHLKEARVGHPNTVTVAAGDIVGASPLLSAAFHDEPTIEAMNSLGLEATLGRQPRVRRGLQGGPAARIGRLPARRRRQGQPGLLPRRQVLHRRGLPDPRGQRQVRRDRPDHPPAVLDQELQRREDRLHRHDAQGDPDHRQPGRASRAWSSPTRSRPPTRWCRCCGRRASRRSSCWCTRAVRRSAARPTRAAHTLLPPTLEHSYDWACDKSGQGQGLTADSPILPIAKNLDPQIDMVISGHTHQPYVCDVPDPDGNSRLVTSASSFGRLFTETDLTYDRRTQDIVRASVKGVEQGRHPDRRQGRRRDEDHPAVQAADRARSPPRSSARSPRRRSRGPRSTASRRWAT